MQRFCALCQRYAGWIVVTLVLLLCQRWWTARNKPERLLEVPEGYLFKGLQNGVLTLEKSLPLSFQGNMTRMRHPGSNRLVPVIAPAKTPFVPALFTMPVTGGPPRPLPPDSIEAALPGTLFTSGADTYRAEYHKTTSWLVGIPPGYGSNYGTGVGVSVGSSSGPPPPPPKPRPPFHTVTNREEADGVKAILRRVSSSGVSSSESITCPMGYVAKRLVADPETIASHFKSQIAFAGDAVYWVKGFPDETTYHESANGQLVGKSVVKRQSAVMTMPLQGGTPRQLLDNVSSDTMLLASEDGVLCQTTRDGREEWILVRPDGTSHQVRTDASQYDPPVECNHCLYWWKSDSSGSPTSTLRIMQANTDGSNPHVLYTASNADRIELKAWHGHVYFRQEDARLLGQSASVNKSTLYRVNLALPSGVERLCPLPDDIEQMRFDGDYVYCLALEEKTGLMDTFRINSAADTWRVLYRYRLPSK